MFNFLNAFRPSREKTDDVRIDAAHLIDENAFTKKLEEAVEQSSRDLKSAALAMSETAVETTKLFKTRLELFERKFDVITDAVDDVIIVKTVNRQWVSVNRFACDIFHLDRDKVIGKNNHEVGKIYPKLKPILDRLDEAEVKAWQEKHPSKFRITIEESGRTLYIDIMITPIDNGDNTVQEIVLVGHNNTKFYESVKQGQAAANFLNAISDPILVLNSYGRVSFANANFEKTFDLAFVDIVGSIYYNVLGKGSIKPLSPLFADDAEYHSDERFTLETDDFAIEVAPIINEHIYAPVYFMLKFSMKPKENRKETE